MLTWRGRFRGVADPHGTNAYLERINIGCRLLATTLLLVMCEEHDVFTHSLHIWVIHHSFVVLQLRVQDCSATEGLGYGISLAERSPYRMR